MKLKIVYLFLLISVVTQAQITIRGKVVDIDNNPLPFVNVFMQGTTSGTTTDDDGRFAFKASKRRGTIEISFVGFQTQTVQVTRKTKFLNIVLTEGSNQLDEVLVVSRPKKRLKKKENPAYRIMKEIWKRKRKMGVKKVDYYQYQKQTTTEIGLNNLDTIFLKSLFNEQYKEAMNEVKYDSDGINYYIPIFINETVKKIYGNNKTNQVREDMVAEKTEGLQAQGFVFNRMSYTFRNVDVFRNNITLLNKAFVSPLSTDGFATYDYVLYDSIVENNKKLYNIFFFPIRDGDLAFQGNFWVADNNFSIKKLRMKTLKGININFVRNLTIEKEFKIKNDSIYLETKNSYEGDFTLLTKNDSNKGLTIKKTEIFENYVLNNPLANNFYTTSIKKYRPDQYEKDETYWKKRQNEDSKSSYKLINNVKKKRKIKKLTGLINTIASGYVNLGNNLQLGPFWTSLANNQVEGFRTKIGIRNFKTVDDRFRINSYIAYGFKDKKIKYGFEGRYLLSYKPRIAIGLAYQNDIEQLGSVLLNTSQLLGRSFGATALFNRGDNYFLSKVKKIATNFDYAVHPNLHIGVNLSHAKISSASPENFKIDYLDNNGVTKNNLTDLNSDIYLSYTPGRFVYGLGVEQRFGRNIFPTFILNYRHGYKGPFNGSFEYDKLQFLYTQPILLGKFGLLDATIEGGKTFGKVPIGLLSPIPANQSFSLVRNTFALQNYYDFVTDEYLATHLEHHFNGFILNRIPLLKKLKLRSLVTFRAAYGNISQKNIDINKSNIIYNAPNKVYYEYGIGLENIGYGNIRFFRVDAIWRNDYNRVNLAIPAPPKFAIRLAIRPGL